MIFQTLSDGSPLFIISGYRKIDFGQVISQESFELEQWNLQHTSIFLNTPYNIIFTAFQLQAFTKEFGLSPPLTLKAHSACPNANYQSFRASSESLICLLFNSASINKVCLATKILSEIFWVSASGSFLASLQVFNFGMFPVFVK